MQHFKISSYFLLKGISRFVTFFELTKWIHISRIKDQAESTTRSSSVDEV